jgi:GH24 family phage-related lysozyme (muramidase)
MPYITAREDAGLSPDQTASAADSYVPAGKRLGVDWIRPSDDDALATVCLAGRYTYPGGTMPLEKGTVRYLNPARFQIPEDAWDRAEPSPASSAPAATQPSAPQPATPIPFATEPSGALLPPELAALTHHYEGCKLEAYVDPKTKAEPITIGWGSTFYKNGSKIRLGDKITQAEADELYEFICHQRFWKVLERQIPFWTEMNNKQRSALCSFAYNLGPDFYGGNDFNTITANLRDRNWAAVPGSLMLYRDPRSPAVVVGLGRRRRAEGLVWIGVDPADAVRQAEQEIKSAEDAKHWEQQLRKNPPTLVGSTAKLSPGPSPAGSGGLDPRGSEENGLIGPKIAAPVKPGDSYLLVNDRDQDMEAYDHNGELLWRVPALARGQGADNIWTRIETDTPPGLYKLGKLYPDYEQNPNPPRSRNAMSYGWFSFDMEELEQQEVKLLRAGIMLHGGGTGCGWPGAWAPNQQLLPTLGCIRLHNVDLRDKVLPLYKQGTVYIGVFQEP